MSIGPRTIIGVAAVVALGACTQRRTADPFAGGASGPREGVQTYRVRLEVVCHECLVSYTIGVSSRQVRTNQHETVWSHTLLSSPRQPETIRLNASTGPEGGALRSVRIFVDGELVASDVCECDDGGGISAVAARTLTAETVIGTE